MKLKLLIAVAQETTKRTSWILSKGFLVALDGGDAIQNPQMHPVPVIIYKEALGIVFCSFALMQASKVVSFFLF